MNGRERAFAGGGQPSSPCSLLPPVGEEAEGGEEDSRRSSKAGWMTTAVWRRRCVCVFVFVCVCVCVCVCVRVVFWFLLSLLLLLLLLLFLSCVPRGARAAGRRIPRPPRALQLLNTFCPSGAASGPQPARADGRPPARPAAGRRTAWRGRRYRGPEPPGWAVAPQSLSLAGLSGGGSECKVELFLVPSRALAVSSCRV